MVKTSYGTISPKLLREYRRRAIERVGIELTHAMDLHPPMASAHEGYAVILEELDELWVEVMKRRAARSTDQMRLEAIQVAAMALRFVIDVTGLE